MPPIDRQKLLFMGKLFSVSMEEFHASCDQPEARAFVDGLYDEYVAQGQPKDLIGWLRERIRGEFRYVMSPPVWALETPSWPFRDGRPMIFISQVDLPRNPVTERLTWNSVIYFFGTREPTERGEKLTFAEVVQERGIHGVGAE